MKWKINVSRSLSLARSFESREIVGTVILSNIRIDSDGVTFEKHQVSRHLRLYLDFGEAVKNRFAFQIDKCSHSPTMKNEKEMHPILARGRVRNQK